MTVPPRHQLGTATGGTHHSVSDLLIMHFDSLPFVKSYYCILVWLCVYLVIVLVRLYGYLLGRKVKCKLCPNTTLRIYLIRHDY